MSHSALETSESGPDIAVGFRLIAGATLVAIGVGLGLYLVSVTLGFVRAGHPIPLINEIVVPAVDQAIDQAEKQPANARQPFDLADDLKRTIVLGIIALLMLFPTIIATSLISGGVSLMQGDAAKALKQIAVKINAQSR